MKLLRSSPPPRPPASRRFTSWSGPTPTPPYRSYRLLFRIIGIPLVAILGVYLYKGVRDRLVAMFAAAGTTSDGRAMDAELAEYGRGMVTAVGDEVDRLEATIMALEPSIRHVDIETN